MHPVLKTFLISVLIGFSFGVYFYYSNDHRPLRIYNSILSCVCIGQFMMLVLYNRQRVLRHIPYQSARVVVLIALLIIATLAGSELTFMLQALLPQGQAYHAFQGGDIYILNILIVLVASMPIYVNEEWNALQRGRLTTQLEQQQLVFELELLRARINPHFLYNIHNTIAGLIPRDPAKAEALVLLLSKFFRFTLHKNSSTFHALREEIDIISTYLHMQQIRYEDRLTFRIDAPNEIADLLFPSFILQPLVENAIKHGIEAITSKGFIEVSLSLEQQQLLVQVRDSGPPFPDTPGSGVGLQMVIRKLKLLYANNFTLELHNKPQKYVSIRLPINDQNLAGRR